MKTKVKKSKEVIVHVESECSKYASMPLNSPKMEAAKKFEGAAMEILKQYGSKK